ncbi:dipeptidase PepV [Alkalihalophilus lindianensis]|uniref:Dipeptidase PepV n=1 Tax=Alkalihalophilus lindianensis TaxID=1630542 RepID=A0ABU3XER9_9BACI|nr:dipeptidase PepV [Alkalihalophilus lindianensis]MDV2686389.1 dipeptidase PepV [Alkalihalophilus lindianensis]
MMNFNWKNEVERRKEKLLNQTQEFLRINSVLDESTASNDKPFGEGIDRALTHMLSNGKDYGFSVKNVDGYAGYVEYGEGDESVGILCHLDVVPAGSGWTSPPFSADIRDGKIFARGAIDNKGPTIAAFFALTLLKELDLKLNKRIRIIFGTDEESNWRCVDHYFKHEEMPTVGFAPDADFPIIHAEKGIMDVNIHYRSQQESNSEVELSLFKSGERLNMVPESAEVIMTGNVEDLKQIIEAFQAYLEANKIEGTYEHSETQLTLTLIGKAAHGSTPEKGLNAGLYLAEFLSNLTVKGIPTFINNIASQFHGDTGGARIGINHEDEISGPLTVNVGKIMFEKDKEAMVGLNIRYPVTAPGEKVIESIQQFSDQNQAEFELLDHMTPSFVDEDHPLVNVLQEVYQRQTGEEATLLAIGGGTYARSLDVGVAFGPMFPGREDVAHQKDEYILIDDLMRATAIYAEAMYELAK